MSDFQLSRTRQSEKNQEVSENSIMSVHVTLPHLFAYIFGGSGTFWNQL